MSDDLYDPFGGDDLYMEDEELEEEEAAAEGEGQNRMFLILVIGMGGLLVVAIGVFLWWLLVYNPRMQAQQQISGAVPTEEVTATVMVEDETPTPDSGEPTSEPTATSEPTETPKPTATPTATPVVRTPTPNPEEEGEGEGGTAEGEPAGEGEATATPRTRRTATPTPQPTPTPTKKVGSGESTSTAATTDETPKTGLGETLLIAGAILMLGVLFTARKLRKA